jgi:peptidyl-prolyl cis-trans isomerase A (cyclophilin A)
MKVLAPFARLATRSRRSRRSRLASVVTFAAAAVAASACAKYDPESVSNGNGAATALVTSAVSAAPPPATAPAPKPDMPADPMAAAGKPAAGPLASTLHPDLLDPSKASAKAPDVFKAKLATTKGDIVIEVHRAWSPNGADRFYNLVKMGFFDDTRFFRAVDGFMVQFGISGDPAVNGKWQAAGIKDDPVTQSNKRGFVTFAQTNLPDSRGTQIFINLTDNARLDGMRFAPFGQVVQGMEVVDALYKGYGEGAPMGMGPDQGLIQGQGNAYLDAKFPRLDGTKHAEIVGGK